MMRIAFFAFRDLSERPVRFALTVVGIALAVATYIAVHGMLVGFEKAVATNITATDTQIQVTEKGAVDFLSSLVPVSLSARIAGAPGVAAASPMLVRLAPVGGRTALLLGWPDDSFLWSSITITKGRKPRAAAPIEALIGAEVAERTGLAIGARLELFGVNASIVGIAETSSRINRAAVFLRLPDLQGIAFRPDQATAINVRLDPASLPQAAEIVRAISARIGSYTVMQTIDLTRDNRLLNAAKALTTGLSAIAVALALSGILNTAWTLARERQHEFAVLRAMGWPLRRIAWFVFCHAAMVGFSGLVLGLVLGYAGSFAAASLPAVSGYIEPTFDLGVVAAAAIVCLIVSVIGTLLPVISIASTDPATVLRSP